MATYYVNLDLPGSGGDGSISDPYHASDLRYIWDGNTLYIKGMYDAPFNVAFSSCTVLPWGTEPYRLSSIRLNFSSSNISGGIFRSTSQEYLLINASTVTNCYLIPFDGLSNSDCVYFLYTSTMKGCTVAGRVQATQPCGGNSILIDNVFAGYILGGGMYADITNCCFVSASIPSGGSRTNCQVDWSAPTMPAWDAQQSAFRTSSLYANITTPPQPGETPYTGYETDLWGNIRTGIGTGFMDTTTPPVWVSNPTIVSFNQTTARVTSTIDKNGTIYGVLLAHGATTPSAVQVKAGTDSFGNPALKGSGSFTANISNYFDITSVVSDTQYDLYCVSEGEVLQASPYGPVQFNTFTSAPDWVSTYPKKSTIRYSKADFLVEINMNGTAYFVALPSGSAAPTSAQVKAGTNSLDQPVKPGYSVSVALLGNVESSLNATNLMSGNTYDVYFVAESESLQDVPVMLSIEVPKVEPINPEKPGHTFYNVVLAGNSEVDSSLPKVTSMFRNIILPNKKN